MLLLVIFLFLFLAPVQWGKHIYLFQLNVYTLKNKGLHEILPPKDYTGSWKTWHYSRELRSVQNCVDGKFEGLSKFYYGEKGGVQVSFHGKSGMLHSEIMFKNNQIHGEAKVYYDNGILQAVMVYENSKPQESTRYNEKGMLITKSLLLENGLPYELTEYDTSGNILKTHIIDDYRE